MLEIERKWVLKEGMLDTFNNVIANYKLLKEDEVLQSYIVASIPEVRLRKHSRKYPELLEKYNLDIKSDGTDIREEVSVIIDAEKYNELKRLVKHRDIKKHYKVWELDGGKHLEFSIVDGGELVYAEVEFYDKEESLKFELPPMLNALFTEVTGNRIYNMRNYWRITREKGLPWK